MEQDTIENVSKPVKNLDCFFFKFHIFLIHQNLPQNCIISFEVYDGFIGQKILKL